MYLIKYLCFKMPTQIAILITFEILYENCLHCIVRDSEYKYHRVSLRVAPPFSATNSLIYIFSMLLKTKYVAKILNVIF